MADEQDRLIARAIESVLDQVPASIDTSVPEGGATKLQPWAETAAPVGRNKRPLEELLVELEERVAADPEAQATLPRTRHPALAFFDRFGRVAEDRPDTPGEGSGRRRRRRRGGSGGQAAQATGGAAVPSSPADGRPAGGRRRSRRGRGGGGGATGAPSPSAGGAPRQDAGGQPRAPGSGRRRRGRRGRGGDRPPAA